MALDPDHLALTDELNGANTVMFPYRHNETHITMLRNRRISLQQQTAEAYVIADGLEPRNCVAVLGMTGASEAVSSCSSIAALTVPSSSTAAEVSCLNDDKPSVSVGQACVSVRIDLCLNVDRNFLSDFENGSDCTPKPPPPRCCY